MTYKAKCQTYASGFGDNISQRALAYTITRKSENTSKRITRTRDRTAAWAKGRVRRHTLGDDPPGDAGRALRLHRGWHHHHARARTDTGLVGSLFYNDAELGGQRREDARDPEPYGSEARVGRRAGGDHRLRRGGRDAATGRTRQHKSLSTRPDRAGDEGS